MSYEEVLAIVGVPLICAVVCLFNTLFGYMAEDLGACSRSGETNNWFAWPCKIILILVSIVMTGFPMALAVCIFWTGFGYGSTPTVYSAAVVFGLLSAVYCGLRFRGSRMTGYTIRYTVPALNSVGKT